VESGKRSDLPELEKTIAACRQARQAVAQCPFISALMERKVDFIGCDTIHILAAVAEFERDAISKRTTEALAAAKARGVTLGNYARTAKAKATVARAESVRPALQSVAGLTATAPGAECARPNDGERWPLAGRADDPCRKCLSLT
jgi:DNA invertase Pin-like site-specific DNA recombinase